MEETLATVKNNGKHSASAKASAEVFFFCHHLKAGASNVCVCARACVVQKVNSSSNVAIVKSSRKKKLNTSSNVAVVKSSGVSCAKARTQARLNMCMYDVALGFRLCGSMYAVAAHHTHEHGIRPCTRSTRHTQPCTRSSLSLILPLTRAGHQEAASRQSVAGVRDAKSPPPSPSTTEMSSWAKGSGAPAHDQLGAAAVASGGGGANGSKARQSNRLLNANVPLSAADYAKVGAGGACGGGSKMKEAAALSRTMSSDAVLGDAVLHSAELQVPKPETL
jgi:hypothetical protein